MEGSHVTPKRVLRASGGLARANLLKPEQLKKNPFGYNVQTAVDVEHALIVAHKVTTDANDQRMLLPMAEAAKQAVGSPPSLNVIADGGYSNGEQSETCEARGIVPYVPPKRTVNNHGDGKLFDRTEFAYEEKSDTFRCPAGQTLWRKQFSKKDRAVTYTPEKKSVVLAHSKPVAPSAHGDMFLGTCMRTPFNACSSEPRRK